jgi:hypothetical protein
MKKNNNQQFNILAITPSTRGFGFAVFEGYDRLVDWGVKHMNGDKSLQSLGKIKEFFIRYQPDVLVLEDSLAKGSRRLPRIRTLHRQIVKLAAQKKVAVKLFSREQVMDAFVPNGERTRHVLAEAIAQRFPEQLTTELPQQRKPWQSEDAKIDIFAAVALALIFLARKKMGKAKNEL